MRAEATALIQPLENQRKELVEALEAELEGIAAQWEPVVADLEAQLGHSLPEVPGQEELLVQTGAEGLGTVQLER